MKGVKAEAVVMQQDSKSSAKSTNGTHVSFSVLAAKNLPSLGSTVNPYACFSFRDVHRRTSVERSTSNPVWNMDMVDLGSVTSDSKEKIAINVSHKTRFFGDTLLCKTNIPVVRLTEAGPGNHQRWVKVPKEGMEQHGKFDVLVLIKYNNSSC